MLGNKSNRKTQFLGIKDGKIILKTNENTLEKFDFVEGHLVDVRKRTKELPEKNTVMHLLDFHIEDPSENTLYILSVLENSSPARSIILSLASVGNFVDNVVNINPYPSRDGKYTNISVKVNNQKVAWVTTDIPKVNKVQVGTKIVDDDSELVQFINNYIEQLQHRLSDAKATPQAAAQATVANDDHEENYYSELNDTDLDL